MAARRRALPALANRLERTVLRAPLAGPDQPRPRHHPRRHDPRRRAGGRDRAVRRQPAVEARVKPADIAFVRLGQHARVAITAYDRSIYGVLEGSVVGISPDAVAEERTGETFYIVRVRTTESVLRAPGSGEAMPIGPGMVAEVDLIGQKRTILQYLLTPITRISETALREQ